MTGHAIRIGPAGWSYKDWEGTVYPKHGSKFDHLAYLAGFFDTIEINSPFYRIPPPAHSKSWVRRVELNPDFRFTTKVYRAFTHEKGNLVAEDLDAFKRYLDPLAESGRLAALLLQFPWSFKREDETDVRLEQLFSAFAAYPMALEVRHASFQSEDFLALLDAYDVGFVNVDQPLFADSVKPAEEVTGRVAYVRLHGRNYEKWFAHDESWERYNYLYSKEEIAPWGERVKKMAREKDTYVITNNHFRGQAIVNAGDLQQSIGHEPSIPPQLAETYGERVAGLVRQER